MAINKKGDLWKFLGILVAVLLLFGVFGGILGLAETAEEEKVQLEAELAGLEGELSAIDGGKWVNYSCNVNKISFVNWNCDNSIGHSADCISNSCEPMPEEIVRIKSRILEIRNRLEVLQ